MTTLNFWKIEGNAVILVNRDEKKLPSKSVLRELTQVLDLDLTEEQISNLDWKHSNYESFKLFDKYYKKGVKNNAKNLKIKIETYLKENKEEKARAEAKKGEERELKETILKAIKASSVKILLEKKGEKLRNEFKILDKAIKENPTNEGKQILLDHKKRKTADVKKALNNSVNYIEEAGQAYYITLSIPALHYQSLTLKLQNGKVETLKVNEQTKTYYSLSLDLLSIDQAEKELKKARETIKHLQLIKEAIEKAFK